MDYPRDKHEWSESEDVILERGYRSGLDISELAHRHLRRESCIKERLIVLGWINPVSPEEPTPSIIEQYGIAEEHIESNHKSEHSKEDPTHVNIHIVPIFERIPQYESSNVDAILQQIVEAAHNTLSDSPKRIIVGHSIIDEEDGWDIHCSPVYQYLPGNSMTSTDVLVFKELGLRIDDIYTKFDIDKNNASCVITDESLTDYLKEEVDYLLEEKVSKRLQSAIAYCHACWARMGNMESFHFLADLYTENDSFLNKDPEAAYELYSLSAHGGHVRSQLAISGLIRSREVRKIESESDYWDSKVRDYCEENSRKYDIFCLRTLSEFFRAERGGLLQDKCKSQDLLYSAYCISTDNEIKEDIKQNFRRDAGSGDGHAHYLIARILMNDHGYSSDHYPVYIELLYAVDAGDENAKLLLEDTQRH